MSTKITIKSYELSSDIFDKILYDYAEVVDIVDSTDPYIHGYKNKHQIVYDNREYLICRECIVNYYVGGGFIPNCTDWKQCRVRRVDNMNCKVDRSMDGQSAWNFMIQLLEHWYTYEEIKEIFHKYEREYDEYLAQYHYTCSLKTGTLVKVDNCYKYDINGAHCDAIAEMFPKASKTILKLYEDRHIHPHNKETINFFVGMLVPKGFRNTYNYIVQRTTKLLYNAIDSNNGTLIYANTDGYVVKYPEKLLKTSTKLGEFKLEYKGDVFVYQDKNYWLMQCGDEMKGSCLKMVRDDIDLRQGKVVHYNRVRVKVKENLYINVAENVTKEIVKWQKL